MSTNAPLSGVINTNGGYPLEMMYCKGTHGGHTLPRPPDGLLLEVVSERPGTQGEAYSDRSSKVGHGQREEGNRCTYSSCIADGSYFTQGNDTRSKVEAVLGERGKRLAILLIRLMLIICTQSYMSNGET